MEEENSFKDSITSFTFCYLGLKAQASQEKGFQVKRKLTTRSPLRTDRDTKEVA